jgi:Methyltransferase domain
VDVETPHPHIVQLSTSTAPALASNIRAAFDLALAGQGQMDEAVYRVGGFCGRRFRLFLNNLIRSLDDPRCLEIGMFKGATLCAAINNNRITAVGIDDWSQFDGPAAEFYANLAHFTHKGARVSIIEQNFRTIDYRSIGKSNVLFYDGSHEEQDQYDGVLMPLPAVDSPAILLVDDWNWDQVRNGTRNALRDAGARVDYYLELRTTLDGTLPEVAFGDSDWHNGLFAGAISKS